MIVRVFAPAKVNLTLAVGAPRDDGMHPLESVVAFADVGDWVSAEAGEALSLDVSGPFAGALAGEGDNLVLRAARALAAATGAAPLARISLDKHLPVASGLGGGSSDAAAALQALNVLWGLGLRQDELAAIGRPLGADMAAFFVGAGGALMSGIGDVVEAFDPPLLHAVLVNPMTPLATPTVYRQFDHMGLGRRLVSWRPQWRRAEDVWADVSGRGNDLMAAAVALAPHIGEILKLLRTDARTRCVLLSGSGATVFALAETRAAAESLAGDVGASRSEWWVRAADLGGRRRS